MIPLAWTSPIFCSRQNDSNNAWDRGSGEPSLFRSCVPCEVGVEVAEKLMSQNMREHMCILSYEHLESPLAGCCCCRDCTCHYAICFACCCPALCLSSFLSRSELKTFLLTAAVPLVASVAIDLFSLACQSNKQSKAANTPECEATCWLENLLAPSFGKHCISQGSIWDAKLEPGSSEPSKS